jgi:isopenicillin N synthase-like dioxygenase
MSPQLDVSSLEHEGIIRVPYPENLRVGIHEAIMAWEAFCALPEDIKTKISYSGDTNVSGNGYEMKKTPGNVDLKENFHLRVEARDALMEEAAKAGDVAENFIDTALSLNSLMAPVIQEFAAAVEKQFMLPNFKRDTMEWQPVWLIRFLHYFGDREPGEVIAAPHPDKGGFTLHLYESHPGLEYLTYAGREWKPMNFNENETAIIPGLRLQYRSENRLKATYHRVVANNESAVSGRFSAVCFIGFANTPNHNKTSNGRTQDYPLAFNYDIPFEEFKKRFTAE